MLEASKLNEKSFEKGREIEQEKERQSQESGASGLFLFAEVDDFSADHPGSGFNHRYCGTPEPASRRVSALL